MSTIFFTNLSIFTVPALRRTKNGFICLYLLIFFQRGQKIEENTLTKQIYYWGGPLFSNHPVIQNINAIANLQTITL